MFLLASAAVNYYVPKFGHQNGSSCSSSPTPAPLDSSSRSKVDAKSANLSITISRPLPISHPKPSDQPKRSQSIDIFDSPNPQQGPVRPQSIKYNNFSDCANMLPDRTPVVMMGVMPKGGSSVYSSGSYSSTSSLEQLIQKCWPQETGDRPNFNSLKETIHGLHE